MKRNAILSLIIFTDFLFLCSNLRVSVSFYEGMPNQMPENRTVAECSLSTSITSSDFQTSSPNNESTSSFTFPPTLISLQNRKVGPSENQTPCIFTRQYTHKFPVSAGPNFIRLHFNLTSVLCLNISNALFSVNANHYTLLTTTESSYPKDASNFDTYYFVKEFYVNVDELTLDVTFTPSNSSESFAFVNAIEVVSMPPNLYIRENSSIPLMGHPNSEIYLDNSTAFETRYRLNVGGNTISAEEDTGMYRVWSEDGDYLMTRTDITDVIPSNVQIMGWYMAPSEVYATVRTLSSGDSLTWSFQLDTGFYYFIRLHFCEILNDVRRHERVFNVYINNHTAEDQADVLHWSNQSGDPVYKDYVVNLTKNSHDNVQNLQLTLQRNFESLEKNNPILNGLENLKLSDANNNLAGPNSFPPPPPPPHSHFHYSMKTIITMILLISILALPFFYALLLHLPKICGKFWLVLCSCYSIRIKKHDMKWESSEHCRYFSFAEIKSATDNFSDINIIGSGGFGKVYKGYINDKNTQKIAIKRSSPTSRQGSFEFLTEIATLSRLRHCHLVSLIGYCMDHKEMILVYDLMSRGNLRDHLYSTENPPLTWEQRLKICIGAARGLHYLHTGMDDMIIHRDVKTSNILLNEDWVAKISDFGLSKLGPNLLNQSETTHVSTVVKGSFGYLDPEYYRRQKLTEKSDVYSFGVVLFEVLCARPAVISTMEEEEEVENYEQVNLAEWVLHCDRTGTLDQIIDPHLKGKIDQECFKTFTEIAKKCLANRRNERPTMGDVLCNLEVAWHHQISGAVNGLCL